MHSQLDPIFFSYTLFKVLDPSLVPKSGFYWRSPNLILFPSPHFPLPFPPNAVSMPLGTISPLLINSPFAPRTNCWPDTSSLSISYIFRLSESPLAPEMWRAPGTLASQPHLPCLCVRILTIPLHLLSFVHLRGFSFSSPSFWVAPLFKRRPLCPA